jgi:uncharacterized membrane protein
LSQVHDLPLAPPFFFILVGLFVILLVLIQLGVLRYAYMRLGISSGAALLLLIASPGNAAVRQKAPFCDGHHIFKVKPAIWS